MSRKIEHQKINVVMVIFFKTKMMKNLNTKVFVLFEQFLSSCIFGVLLLAKFFKLSQLRFLSTINTIYSIQIGK